MRMNMPRFLPLLLIAVLFSSPSAYSQGKTSISRVVIDAGHGGKDPGTLGKKTQEKKITLAIALKVGEKIRNSCKDVKVLYTRDKDHFVELFQRAETANRNKADLFISIHCNANPVHTLKGSETYVMGLHRSHANLEIAKQENASILMEPDYVANYNGFDPNSDESYITFTLFQNAFLDQSMKFASYVQDAMKDRTGLDDRGVRQAGFLVLYKTTMPSVLIETGFLSNPEEENFLISEKGQDYIASAIARAFVKFKEGYESSRGKNLPEEKNDTFRPAEPVAEKKAGKEEPALTQARTDLHISFRIQVAMSAKEIPVKSKIFKDLPDIRMYKHEGNFKYTTGNMKTLDEALKKLPKIWEKGFKDAFVVAFRDNERIPMKEAKQALGIPEKKKE
jgi:N-acetylmuramoyl-L-alanine amidase